jgi:hypothetical protein
MSNSNEESDGSDRDGPRTTIHASTELNRTPPERLSNVNIIEHVNGSDDEAGNGRHAQSRDRALSPSAAMLSEPVRMRIDPLRTGSFGSMSHQLSPSSSLSYPSMQAIRPAQLVGLKRDRLEQAHDSGEQHLKSQREEEAEIEKLLTGIGPGLGPAGYGDELWFGLPGLTNSPRTSGIPVSGGDISTAVNDMKGVHNGNDDSVCQFSLSLNGQHNGQQVVRPGMVTSGAPLSAVMTTSGVLPLQTVDTAVLRSQSRPPNIRLTTAGVHCPMYLSRSRTGFGSQKETRRRCKVCRLRIAMICKECDVALCFSSSLNEISCWEKFHMVSGGSSVPRQASLAGQLMKSVPSLSSAPHSPATSVPRLNTAASIITPETATMRTPDSQNFFVVTNVNLRQL